MRGIFDRIAIGPIRRSTIKKVPWSVHSFAREHYPFCIYLIISLSCGYIYIYIYKKCIVFDELTWFLGWKKKKEKKKIVKAMIHWFVRAFRKILRVLICFCSVILGERSSRSKITLSYEIHCDHNDSLIFFPVSRSRRFDFSVGQRDRKNIDEQKPQKRRPSSFFPSLFAMEISQKIYLAKSFFFPFFFFRLL